MLVIFVSPIMKEGYPHYSLIQQDEISSHFYKKVTVCLNRKFPEKLTVMSGLSLGHLVRLNLLPFISFVVHQRCSLHVNIGYNFVRIFWEDTSWNWYICHRLV
jgi:hypothetical protein